MWPGHTGLELLLRTVSFPAVLWRQPVLIVTMATQAPASHPQSRKKSKKRRKSKQRYVAMELTCFYFEKHGFLWSPTCGLHHWTCLYSKEGERRTITRLLWTLIALLGKGGIKVRWRAGRVRTKVINYRQLVFYVCELWICLYWTYTDSFFYHFYYSPNKMR